MLENKEKEIKGTIYSVTVMDGMTALEVQTRLFKILGSSLGELKNLTKDDLNVENIAKLITPIFQNTTPGEIQGLVELLFRKGVFTKERDKNGTEFLKKVEIETHFAGKSIQIWEVVAFILMVNFGFQLD